MNINDAGIALIKRFEGCSLRAYPDPATGGDPWTIGYGVTGPNVYEGLQISQEQADAWLMEKLAEFEKCVNKAIFIPITDNQFSACVSLAYNVGCRNFQGSTLVKKLNAGDDIGASDEFAKWNKAAGKEMAGLTKRREAERDLFLS